jgi:hypothetical protein
VVAEGTGVQAQLVRVLRAAGVEPVLLPHHDMPRERVRG